MEEYKGNLHTDGQIGRNKGHFNICHRQLWIRHVAESLDYKTHRRERQCLKLASKILH